MSLQYFSELIAFQPENGVLFNTFTAAKSVINPTALKTLDPNYLRPGKLLRTRIRAGLSNIVTTPGTVVFQIMLGNIVIWSSGLIQMNAIAHTLLPITLEVIWKVLTAGSGTSATVIGGGVLTGLPLTLTAGQVDAVNTPGAFPVPAAAPAAGTGFDSTIANILDFWTGFSINNAGNGIQISEYTTESLN